MSCDICGKKVLPRSLAFHKKAHLGELYGLGSANCQEIMDEPLALVFLNIMHMFRPPFRVHYLRKRLKIGVWA